MRSENMAKNASECSPIAKISVMCTKSRSMNPRRCQNFDRKLDSSLCLCAIQIWPETAQNDWCNVWLLQVAVHRNCHLFSWCL